MAHRQLFKGNYIKAMAPMQWRKSIDKKAMVQKQWYMAQRKWLKGNGTKAMAQIQ